MKKTTLTLLFILFFSMHGARADDIGSLPPGHWFEVDGSELAQEVPYPRPPGVTGYSSIMSAWSGGAYDTKRDRLLIWGGGHANYAGNEIYAFDLNTFSWSRIWGPTPNSQIPTDRLSFEIYNDGNPSARETYDSLEYLPDPYDGLWNQGGSRWNAGGSGTQITWFFNFTNRSWERKADKTYYRGGYPATAYDSATGHIFHRDKYHIMEYIPETDEWNYVRYDSAGNWSDEATGVIDPIRGKMYFIGGSEFRVLDLENPSSYKYVTLKGDFEIVDATAPGLAYSPKDDVIVAWSGDSYLGLDPRAVYILDLDTLVWKKRMPAPTNTVTPTDTARWGTFGRFRYVPSKNVFILVNSIYENVFFYRLSGGSVSDNTPPTTPQNLNGIGGEGTAELYWDPSTDHDSGIRAYRVYRDDALVGESSQTYYQESNVPSGQHVYQVSSLNNALIESEQSLPVEIQVCETIANLTLMLQSWKDGDMEFHELTDHLYQWKDCGP